MKKIVILLWVLGTFLIGCSNSDLNEPRAVPLHPLFSDEDHKYSLLVVDETDSYDIRDEWMEKNEIRNVKTINKRVSLEETTNQYKFLELEKSPAFVVFDTKGIVFQTYSEKELIDFLKTNNPN
ncbi:hypothetical protein [uncultured Metabacillus sp.]|uniref:hypothetical protein n=1 Tax=uncultured Metabacillus sp. TaxID=2860135 RepID=UPI002612C60E|nr:hypothetical protein [uncultured Metabacillus sp.]